MQVRKVMTKNPACCTSDSTLEEVAHMMDMYDCGCIPVVDSHQTMRPIGTITDRDIAIRAVGANKNPLEMKASDIMTKDIVTVTPETSVQDCMNVMENRQIRRVLVVDKNGRCTGIVAQADLAEREEHPSQTANFVREVSESNNLHDRGYESNRPQFNERRIPERNNYSFSRNESRSRSNEMRYKPHTKKQSFFNSTTLLTLLGSIGLGAGLKYYLDSENEHRTFNARKVKNYNTDTKNMVDKKSGDLSLDAPITSAAPSTSTVTNSTENRDTISGSVGSFNKTDDDTDLKPIVEVGRTTGGR